MSILFMTVYLIGTCIWGAVVGILGGMYGIRPWITTVIGGGMPAGLATLLFWFGYA